MARTVTVRRKEGGGITVRRGTRVVGTVTQLEGGDEQMSGRFTPQAGDDDELQMLAGADAAAREDAGFHVFSAVHDMRIDVEGTLMVEGDRVRFKPDPAYIVLKSGGLG